MPDELDQLVSAFTRTTNIKDLIGDLKDFTDKIVIVLDHWNKVREDKSYEWLSTMFSDEVIDILDELAEVQTCSEGEIHKEFPKCRRVCFPNWDFCEEHGRPKAFHGPVKSDAKET